MLNIIDISRCKGAFASAKFESLILNYPLNRWLNIILAVFFFLFNLVGLPTYSSAYDKFLIVVGLMFNVLIFWYAWKW